MGNDLPGQSGEKPNEESSHGAGRKETVVNMETSLKDNTVHPRGTDRAKVIQVIVTESLSGAGTEESPLCIVKQYWDFEGNLLASDHTLTDVV